MKNNIRFIGLILVSLILSLSFVACSGDDDASIVGKWNCTNKASDTTYWVFKSGGKGYTMDNYGDSMPFSYKLKGSKLIVAWDGDWEDPDEWRFVISGNVLTLYYIDSGEVDWTFTKDGGDDSES